MVDPISDGGISDAALPDASPVDPCEGMGRDLYVDPQLGDDSLTGLSPFEPHATINRSILAAVEGDCINLRAGIHRGDVTTQRAGTAERPITLRGPPEAIVRGTFGGSSVVVRIEHDHVHLVGFTIDGLDGDPSQATSYHRSLVEARSHVANEGVEGFVGRNLVLRNALRHCVTFRYFTEDSELESSTIANCGLETEIFGGTSPGYGIAIGTSPSSLDNNPTPDPDASIGNRVLGNSFRNVGVCVRIGESADETLIENNTCSAEGFPTLAGIDLRSNSNIVRGNEVLENDGAGIRLGGENPTDGTMNVIRENTIRDNLSGGIRFQIEPQSEVCGNVMSGNQGGDATGAFGANFAPTAPCP